jgi:DNA-directed RNA polymerase subunit RPC12/RpoP
MRLRRYVACKLCGGTLQLLGQLGRLAWYRCRHCGIEVSKEFRRESKS